MGPGDEFSPSQLPDAFVQLSDPVDGKRGSSTTAADLFILPHIYVKTCLPTPPQREFSSLKLASTALL